MPQIEIPFTIGQRVRAGDYEFEVVEIWFRGGRVTIGDGHGNLWAPGQVTLVETVIYWERNAADTGTNGYVGDQWRWFVRDTDGLLEFAGAVLGTFDNPRAVAEETQRLWNARKR